MDCNYLSEGRLCQAVSQQEEAKAARVESCTNVPNNLCCYLCAKRETCEISCNYLRKPEPVAASKQEFETEIATTRTAIEKLSLLLAEGKISEQSYLNSVKALEARMERLSSGAETPSSRNFAPSSIPQTSTLAETFERPTVLWYFVPFFFGLLGGLVGYLGVKDRDEDMARSLLVFGIVWSVLLFFITLIFWASIISTIYRFR
jgi:hypothetical protein